MVRPRLPDAPVISSRGCEGVEDIRYLRSCEGARFDWGCAAALIGTVAQLTHILHAGAMCTAEDNAGFLQTVADDAHTAVCALGCHCSDRAFKAVEGVGSPRDDELKG